MKKWTVLAMALCVAMLTVAPAVQAVDDLVLMDFEGNDEGRPKGGEVTTEQAKTGQASLKWAHGERPAISFEMLPEDWSAYNQMSFWMYSAVANDAEFMMTIGSEDPSQEGGDYYHKEIKVDWTGWKHFELPFWSMGVARHPQGWQKIDGMSMNANGWGNEAKDDTLLYIDDVRLQKVPLKLANGSLEDEDGDGAPDGWAWRAKPEAPHTSAEMVPGRTGQAVKMTDTAKDKSIGLWQVLPVDVGKTYTFSCWKKGGSAAIYLMYQGPDKEFKEVANGHKNKDPEAFEQVSVSAPAPEGADRVGVWIYSWSTAVGEVIVDDAEISVSE